MKKLLGCFLCVMLLVFGVASNAWTTSFGLQGVNYPSTISAAVDFNYDGVNTINIDITNTSTITSSLTAFAFNVPTNVDGASLIGTVPTGWSALFNPDGINTPGQYGSFDLAGDTGGPTFNGGSVADGIPAPPDTKFSFSFLLTGTNLNLLNENSFLGLLSEPGPGQSNPQPFIARFQGIGPDEEGSDVAVVPEPTTMLLLGFGLVGLAGFGRKRFKK
jgi:hypothetical protein